jgi:Big-like domain-containing protein
VQRIAEAAAPPYRTTYRVPLQGQLSISAIAYDDVGPSEPAGPVIVPIVPDAPPLAAVLSPANGAQIVAGTSLTIVADATDDVSVSSVAFVVNGTQAVNLSGTSPYKWTIQVPGPGPLSIHVVARDSRGHSTASPNVVVTVVPDPLTSVVGRVVGPGGAPVAGAAVDVSGLASAQTGPDGRFQAVEIPTTGGDLSASATGSLGACLGRGRLADAVPPVAGGVTDLGDITLESVAVGTARVMGRVVTETGEAVSGLPLYVYSEDMGDAHRAVTQEDGAFSLSGFPARGRRLSLLGRGIVGGTLWGVIGFVNTPAVAGSTIDFGEVLAFPLEDDPEAPHTTVSGTVVFGFERQPVAGAKVVVVTQSEVLTTVSDSDGRYQYTDVPVPLFSPGATIGASAIAACEYLVLDPCDGGGLTLNPEGPTDGIDIQLFRDTGFAECKALTRNPGRRGKVAKP